VSAPRPYRLHRRFARLQRELDPFAGGPGVPPGGPGLSPADLDPPPGDLDLPLSDLDRPLGRPDVLPDYRGAHGRRFDSLPRRLVAGHEVPVAVGHRARALGLALLDRADAGPGLLIPRCAAVHTFGMRFALDVYFLSAGGEILSERRAVPPRRFVSHRGAVAVLEVPA
jgi:hypothetical protein